MQRLKRYLVTGVVVIGPAVLTIYVLYVVFRFADGLLGNYLNAYLMRSWGFYIPGVGFLVSLIIILLTGFFANLFLGKKIIPGIERWFSRLPLIRNIYPTFKQIIRFVLQQKEFGFKKVVLVEYPSAGLWSLGFITNEEFPCINQACQNKLIAVFVPNSPGPLTGYVVFFPQEKVKFLDMPVIEAIKIIISGGVFKAEE